MPAPLAGLSCLSGRRITREPADGYGEVEGAKRGAAREAGRRTRPATRR